MLCYLLQHGGHFTTRGYSLLTLMVMATTNANFGAKHVQNGN